ncbi:ATP-grasp domain-containing protein [Paraburkholderia tropica]|uniref:ATP-grasp domain-containing protein n=1 Tax=Paraburkholderia tropica TaxID=92647 RepID=UPI0032B54F33
MMPPHLVILGGGLGLCDRARHFGAHVTLIDTPQTYDATLVHGNRRTVLSYYDDPALIPMLQALHKQEPVSAVLAMTELALLPAARISAALGLPGISPAAVERTRDKLAMRDWLRHQHFSTIACAEVRSAGEIRAFAEVSGYPVIVKPRDGQGSQRIMCFHSANEVGTPVLDDHVYIAEPFLDGPEFSVEAFSFGGRHMIAAITGKFTNERDLANPFVEIGHVVPAPLAAGVGAQIEAYVKRFLAAMELTDGCTHTEVRLTSNGPEVVETHTRVGGDSIPTLVRQATGCDLLDLAVQWPLGLVEAADTLADWRVANGQHRAVDGAAAIRFFTPPPGKVHVVTGVHKLRGLPGILALHFPLKEGDTVDATCDSFSRHGYVIATARSAQDAMYLCDSVIDGVTIEVRP